MPTDDAMTEDQALLSELIARLQVAGTDLADDAPLNEVLRAAIEQFPETETAVSAESAEIKALRVRAAALPDVEARLRTVQAEDAAGRGERLVAAELERGTIRRDNVELIAAARSLAETDEAQFQATFAAMSPLEVRTSSGGGLNERSRLIRASSARFDRDRVGDSGAKRQYYIAGDLVDAGLPELTAAELKGLK